MNDPGTHKLSDAMKGHQPPSTESTGQHGPTEPQGHGPAPAEVAEETRRQQEARPEPTLDRDKKLTEIGRGSQTHG